MPLKQLFLALCLGFSLAFTSRAGDTGVFHLPPTVSSSPASSLLTSNASLDGPKVLPINASSYDWWYFDVVDADPSSNASVVIVFYHNAPDAFLDIASSNTTLFVQLAISFPNGTLRLTSAPVLTPATAATVTTMGNGSSGEWVGSGFSWKFTPSTGAYDISIDSEELDVQGSIHFTPRAPAHYPCGPAVPGQNMEVGPTIGWANAVPDALSIVNLVFGGSPLTFTGAGYHDKNWSNQLFSSAVSSWYWGHATLGPYSLVWFDFLATNGTEYVSAYLARSGTPLTTSCTAGAIRVRPTGANSTYPPKIETGPPEGYTIVLDAGEDGQMEVNVSTRQRVFDIPGYTRGIGSATAAIISKDGETGAQLSGVTLFEQFALTP